MTPNTLDRMERLEEKIAFVERDVEPLDTSIRELYEHVDELKRLLTGVHAQVEKNTLHLAGGGEQPPVQP